MVLVYGPDIGLVRERVEALSRSIVADPADPFRVSELTPDRLRAEPSLLSDELAAMSLTGGRRLVVVRSATDELTTSCKAALEDWHGDSLLLLEAANLAARSKLRQLAESSRTAAALPCYADEGESLHSLVTSALAEFDVNAEAETIEFLVEHLGSDRRVSRSELAKLALYVGAGGTATADDAAACVGDSAARTLDDLVFAAGAGNYAGLEVGLTRAWHENTAPVSVLRAAQRHLQRLLRVRAATDGGTAPETALRGLQPPVFWKQRPAFQAQVERWSPEQAASALALLTEAELQSKTTGIPDRAVCSRALLAVTQLARRPARPETRGSRYR